MTIPARTATDNYLACAGLELDIVFDVDLGELVRGHHVVARGIMFGRLVRVPRADIDELRALMNQPGAPGNSGGGSHIRRLASPAPREFDERLTDAELHYEFVPGLSHAEADGRFDWGGGCRPLTTLAASMPTTTAARSTAGPGSPPPMAAGIWAARSRPKPAC
jgi:hypothetical protein